MYKVLNFNGKSGTFEHLSSYPHLDECKSHVKSRGSSLDTIIIYESENNLSGDEETKVIMDTIKANNGKILRVYKGVSIHKQDLAACCGGTTSNCYCIVTSSERYCEAAYCDNTHCWVVRCPIPCGC